MFEITSEPEEEVEYFLSHGYPLNSGEIILANYRKLVAFNLQTKETRELITDRHQLFDYTLRPSPSGMLLVHVTKGDKFTESRIYDPELKCLLHTDRKIHSIGKTIFKDNDFSWPIFLGTSDYEIHKFMSGHFSGCGEIKFDKYDSIRKLTQLSNNRFAVIAKKYYPNKSDIIVFSMNKNLEVYNIQKPNINAFHDIDDLAKKLKTKNKKLYPSNEIIDIVCLNEGFFATLHEIHLIRYSSEHIYLIHIWDNHCQLTKTIHLPHAADKLHFIPTQNTLFSFYTEGRSKSSLIDVITGEILENPFSSLFDHTIESVIQLTENFMLLTSGRYYLKVTVNTLRNTLIPVKKKRNLNTTEKMYQLMILSKQYLLPKKQSALQTLPAELFLRILYWLHDWNSLLVLMLVSTDLRNILKNLQPNDMAFIFKDKTYHYSAKLNHLNNLFYTKSEKKNEDIVCFAHRNPYRVISREKKLTLNTSLLSTYTEFYLIFDGIDPKEIYLPICTFRAPIKLCFSLNDDYLFFTNTKNNIIGTIQTSNRALVTKKYNTGEIHLICPASNNHFIIYEEGNNDSGLLHLIQIFDDQIKTKKTVPLNGKITSLTSSLDGKTFACTSTQEIYFFNAESLHLYHHLTIAGQLTKVCMIDTNTFIAAYVDQPWHHVNSFTLIDSPNQKIHFLSKRETVLDIALSKTHIAILTNEHSYACRLSDANMQIQYRPYDCDKVQINFLHNGLHFWGNNIHKQLFVEMKPAEKPKHAFPLLNRMGR